MPFWEWCLLVVLPGMAGAGGFCVLSNYRSKKLDLPEDKPAEPVKGYSCYHDVECPTCRAAQGWACETDEGNSFGNYQVHWSREQRWCMNMDFGTVVVEDRESASWD